MTDIRAVRAEVLFLSDLTAGYTYDPNNPNDLRQLRITIRDMILTRGIAGVAADTAAEFGDHPDLAVGRMRWALATVDRCFPRRVALVTTLQGSPTELAPALPPSSFQAGPQASLPTGQLVSA